MSMQPTDAGDVVMEVREGEGVGSGGRERVGVVGGGSGVRESGEGGQRPNRSPITNYVPIPCGQVRRGKDDPDADALCPPGSGVSRSSRHANPPPSPPASRCEFGPPGNALCVGWAPHIQAHQSSPLAARVQVRRGKDDPEADAQARDVIRQDLLGLPQPPPQGGKKGREKKGSSGGSVVETMESRRMIQVRERGEGEGRRKMDEGCMLHFNRARNVSAADEHTIHPPHTHTGGGECPTHRHGGRPAPHPSPLGPLPHPPHTHRWLRVPHTSPWWLTSPSPCAKNAPDRWRYCI